jgi:hypothetical protein
MIISLEFDDFSPQNNLDLLYELVSFFRNFKVTLFTIPWFDVSNISEWRNDVVRGINEGWLEIAYHGLTHQEEEFYRLTYDDAMEKIIRMKEEFRRLNIPVVNLFKSPYWASSSDSKKAILDSGLRIVEVFYFNWNLKDPMPKEERVIGHGHIQNEGGNGLQESLDRIKEIPIDAEWEFVSKVI